MKLDPKKAYESMRLMYDVLNMAKEELAEIKGDLYRDVARIVEILYKKLAEKLGWKVERLDVSVGSFAVAVDFAIKGVIDDLRENPHAKAAIIDTALDLLGVEPKVRLEEKARE